MLTLYLRLSSTRNCRFVFNGLSVKDSRSRWIRLEQAKQVILSLLACTGDKTVPGCDVWRTGVTKPQSNGCVRLWWWNTLFSNAQIYSDDSQRSHYWQLQELNKFKSQQDMKGDLISYRQILAS
jgi:hypothetical protein